MQPVPSLLPVGWRFHPTDFELLDHYLKNKRLGHLTSCFYILEFDLCNFNPSELLPESSDEEYYFFCRPEFYLENGKPKTKRKARTGYWKGTGKASSVTNKDSDEEIGTRKIFVYHDPNRTKWVIHEYAYTAKLDLPFKGDFVLCKLHINKKNNASKKSTKIQQNSKKKANKKSKDMELGCKEDKSNKKARIDLSNCNSTSASNFEHQNLEAIPTNSACGEDEPHNHITSDYENQNPDKIVEISSYEIGESSYLKDSNFEYGSPYDTSAFSTYNQGEECISMTKTPYGIHNVSTCNEVETSDLEYQNPNERYTPGCQWASGVEDQNPYEIPTVSTNNKDETGSRMDFNFENPYPFNMSFNSSYDDGKSTIIANLDFGSQNPSMNPDISFSEEGKWNHLNRVYSYFENLIQCENTDNSTPGDYWSTCTATPYIQDTTFKDVESQHNNKDVSNFEGHPSVLADTDLGDYSFSEKDSQLLKEIFACDEQENAGCYVLQQPIHNKENPTPCVRGISVSIST